MKPQMLAHPSHHRSVNLVDPKILAVPSALDNLDESICALNQSIERLKERLFPVLDPSPPEAQSEGLKEPMPNRIADRIQFASRRIQELDRGVNTVTAGLQV